MKLFLRIDLKIKPKIILVNICVNNEAKAAPVIPLIGINIKFKIIFINAPVRFIFQRTLCLPSARIQMFRTEPKYENVVYQTINRSTEIEVWN